MAVDFGFESGLWERMVANGDEPQKVADLAKQLGIQEELLQRFMRHIAATGRLDVVGPHHYRPNNFTRALGDPVLASGYRYGYVMLPLLQILPNGSPGDSPSVINPICIHAHKYFKQRGYTVPTTPFKNAYQFAHQTELHMFDHITQEELRPWGDDFNNLMKGYFTGRPAWADPAFYPAQDRLIDGFDATDKNAAMVVDVAGGAGHYTEQFRSLFPDAPGRLVVQDLPRVIDSTPDLHPKIEKMPYDFFTEQPVKGKAEPSVACIHADGPRCACILHSFHPPRLA
jgi:hypothetical protein